MAEITTYPTIAATEIDAKSPITQELIKKFVDLDRANKEYPVGNCGHAEWGLIGNSSVWVDMPKIPVAAEVARVRIPVHAERLIIVSEGYYNHVSGSSLDAAIRFKLNAALSDEFDMFALGLAKDLFHPHVWTLDVTAGDRGSMQTLSAECKNLSSTSDPSNSILAGWVTGGTADEKLSLGWVMDPDATDDD